MIKKIILGLGIIFLSFIGFSNAGKLQTVGFQDSESIYDSNYLITFLKGGGVLSNYLGTSKSVLALNSNTLFWWNWNGLPYFYDGHGQGYFSQYCSCDLLTSESTGLSNCSCLGIDENSKSIFNNYFKNLVAGDYVYYDYSPYYAGGGATCNVYNWGFAVCFSASSVGRSLCFNQGTCYNGCQGGVSACRNFCSRFGGCGSLINSNGYTNLSFGNIPYSEIGYAPGQAGYDGGGNIDGSSNVGENTTVSGNVMYSTCTNGYVVSYVTQLYGGINNICYAGTNNTGIINDWVARTPMSQGLNFKEVYNGSLNVTINGATPYYSSYLDWFNTWMYAMQKYKLGQIGFDVFNGQPVYLYAYFDRLYQNGVIPGQTDAYNIANICKLALFSDYTQEYKGTQFSEVCDILSYNPGNSGIVTTGEVGNIDNDNQEILPPGTIIGGGSNGGSSNTSSGTIISVDWSGTLSGNTNKNFDGKTFINDFYQKLQANFQKPTNDLTGIVPVYIYVFLIALILFRFLSH